MSKRERNVVAIPQTLLDRLKKIKDKTGTPITWHTEKAIEQYLRKMEVK